MSLSDQARRVEDWWFDRTRRIHTSQHATRIEPADVIGDVRDSHPYIPVRVGSARSAIRALPITDVSTYTFVDMGSGEGRVLFIAAEWPFRRIIGVEFDRERHARAEANVRSFRHRAARCRDLRPIHADAADFTFPAGNLVVYFFNPFGPQVFGAVLTRLRAAIASEARHVVVLMQWPVLGQLVAATPEFRLVLASPRWQVYEAGHATQT